MVLEKTLESLWDFKEINLAAAALESRSLKTSGFSRTNLISDQNKYHFKPEHTWFQPEKKKKTKEKTTRFPTCVSENTLALCPD